MTSSIIALFPFPLQNVVVSAMAGSSSSGIVTFNIGGCTGSTTTTTLQKYPESTLFRLALRSVGKLQPIVDDKGRIFIDREGSLFHYIINFMRTGNLDLPEGFREYKRLLADADFYKLSTLREAVLSIKPGLENAWSGKALLVELETDENNPHLVKLNLPSFDEWTSNDMAALSSHPTFCELDRLANGQKGDRLQKGAQLLKMHAELLAVSTSIQGPAVHVLEKWLIRL